MFQFEIEDSLIQTEVVDGSSVPKDETGYEVGDRILSGKDFGTVKYIGAVNPHPGTWLGIEWDNSSRGKHNGSVDGVQYFCSSKPNAASFVRTSKVRKIRDIISALHIRYGFDLTRLSTLKQIEDRMDKMKIDYRTLKTLDLSSHEIGDLGKPEEFVKLCPNIEFLNLADNCITSWEPIALLCKNLRVKRLDISENPIPIEGNLGNYKDCFAQLDHLILGRVNYDWKDVMTMSILWPRITNLQLPFNKISAMSPPQNSLLLLTSIDLETNQISSWEEVIKLNACSRLEYLNLSGNQISHVQFEVNSDAYSSTVFPNLMRLNLTSNRIQNWSSINELNKLQKLRELRSDLNPFHNSDSRAGNRQMIIARIGRLQKCEGVEIDRQERRDAELDYVKKFSTKWNEAREATSFAAEHPRYLELVEKFGESQKGEIALGEPAMKTRLIDLEFVPENSDYKPYSKKLIPNMTVQKLRMLVQRNYKLPTSRIEIKVLSTRNPDISFTLENDFYDLTQYSIEDGDKLYLKW